MLEKIQDAIKANYNLAGLEPVSETKEVILAKSGPLDFATKGSFPLFLFVKRGLVHMYQNHFIYFPILYFCFATTQKPILPATGFPVVIERLKFMDFEEARYGQLDAVCKILLGQVSKVDRLSSQTKCGKN